MKLQHLSSSSLSLARVAACLLLTAAALCSCGDFYTYEEDDSQQKPTMVLYRDTIDILAGDTCRLIAFVMPAVSGDVGVEWESDADSIATVTGDSLLALKAGVCKVVARSVVDATVADTCLVRVVGPWRDQKGEYMNETVVYADISVHGRQPSDMLLVGAFVAGLCVRSGRESPTMCFALVAAATWCWAKPSSFEPSTAPRSSSMSSIMRWSSTDRATAPCRTSSA